MKSGQLKVLPLHEIVNCIKRPPYHYHLSKIHEHINSLIKHQPFYRLNMKITHPFERLNVQCNNFFHVQVCV